MTMTKKVSQEIYLEIQKILGKELHAFTDDMPLIGDESLLDSMQLVELCLALEDKASEMGFDFDWTSESAMSRSRSMFRTSGSLVAEFIRQMESNR